MFDYLAVLISIILGLALTHLLFGCSRLIQLRGQVRIYWVQLVWTATVLFYVLALWWGMFWWKHLTLWSFQTFFFLVLYSIVVFMLASIVFPMEFGEGADFEAYFFKNRRWFFGLYILALLLDIPETLTKSFADLRPVPKEYVVFIGAMLAAGAAAFFTSNRKAHAVISVVTLASFVAYLTLTTLDTIDAR